MSNSEISQSSTTYSTTVTFAANANTGVTPALSNYYAKTSQILGIAPGPGATGGGGSSGIVFASAVQTAAGTTPYTTTLTFNAAVAAGAQGGIYELYWVNKTAPGLTPC